jgi:hypothetical protein
MTDKNKTGMNFILKFIVENKLMFSIPSSSLRFTLIIKVVVQILVQMEFRNYHQKKGSMKMTS